MIYIHQYSVERLQVKLLNCSPVAFYKYTITVFRFFFLHEIGICAKTVIAPAERIKMSFQVSSDRFTLGTALARTVRFDV